MATKKKVRRGLMGMLVVMGIYAGMVHIGSVRAQVHAFGSWCCAAGVRIQQAVMFPFRTWCKYGASITSLHGRIDRLQKERDSLWEELIKREGVVTYSHDTKDLRSYAERYQYKGELILAQCILKTYTPDQQVIIVDKGLRHGVTTSMVAVYKNMLIGRVSDVQDWHSKVTLITDRLCKISAFCVQTHAAGIVEGVNKLDELQLSYISHLSAVQEGDEVLSSGQGLIFPRGFALGTIVRCEIDGLYYKITLKPCIDPVTIDFCYLLEKGSLSGLEAGPEPDQEEQSQAMHPH